MLAERPPLENVSIHTAFRTFGPLTIRKFVEVAACYNLPEPNFDPDVTKFVRRQFGVKGVCVGMVRVQGDEECGILRWVGSQQDFLKEACVMKGFEVGLSRLIDETGLVTYTIFDSDYNEIEVKKFDKNGKLLSTKNSRRGIGQLRNTALIN